MPGLMPDRVYFHCERGNPLHYFHFEQIDGTPRLDESFSLRFQVYCAERGFLRESAYPDGHETDDHDAHATHFAGFYGDGTMAGTARLVEGPVEALPLSGKCQIDPDALPPGLGDSRVTEISRLAVSKAFRRRLVDGILPESNLEAAKSGAVSAKRRRNCPELVLGLYKILYHHSKREGIAYWFAAMESSLAKLLDRFHFEFKPVGPEIDYYGPVRPYVASLDDLELKVYQQDPELFWSFMEGLDPEYLPAIARTSPRPPAGPGD
jgi:N-acyl amino acid synthase of PEP-CTERM/exosortase system